MDTTLLKGLNVLEHLVRVGKGLTITELASDLEITKSNAFRVLKTLESAGYAVRDPVTKDFRASMKLWELGILAASQLDLGSHAAGPMRRLAEASRETVHLAILEGLDVLYVDKIDSVEPVASYTKLGGRAPAYCVATGKALLSQLSDHELMPHLAHLERHSEFTITDPVALRADLAIASANGYSINRGEWRASVWGMASVVRNAAGEPIAAIGVSGPEYRLAASGRFDELAVLVQDAAAQISRGLGYEAR